MAAATIYLEIQEKKQDVIQLENVDSETIFFYRDDCPSCNKIFKRVYVSGLLKGNQKNVNLNQEKNRKYISTFDIEQVPTIIQKGNRYEGQKEIKKFIKGGSNSREVDE